MIRSVRKTFTAAFACAMLPSVAGAAPAPLHVRGTIASVSPSALTVTTDKGPVVVAVGPKTGFAGAVPGSVGDVKSGTFIGSANVDNPNGAARALEVVVFPDSMRGRGEGNYPWDLPAGGAHSSMTNGTVAAHRGSMMTNATVGRVSGGSSTRVVSVAYKGGTKQIAIGPSTPIVRLEPGTAKLLVPGAHVFVVAIPNGGKLAGAFVVAGENGTVPPM